MEGAPQHIGRYEVVGQLALGGMAEILLGRIHGPSGFERVVAIKRVLPHFAQHKAFKSMFLDEARIAAAIRHPNVVQVHELGQNEEDLFLVMEYLEGESVAGIMRRLAVLGEPLDCALVTFIGAQVCTGLHAAHQLEDHRQRPLGIVHRDISPQNVFVTYDGMVKILDFGIAKAADRATQTDAGVLKGKLSYMSPEQCVGEPLDRRSDIFSLGIVLHEMVTGRRLFEREAKLQALQAVLTGAIVMPSVYQPDVPAGLEGVIFKALERRPEDRFVEAQSMCEALNGVLQGMDAPSLPGTELSALMRRIFPDRIEEKSHMLRRIRAGSIDVVVPVAEGDTDVELPTVDIQLAATKPTEGKAPRRARSLFVALSLLALVVVAGGVALWAMLSPPPAPPPSVVATPAVVAEAEPRVEGAAAPSAPLPPPPSKVTLTVGSVPEGARVTIDGSPVGKTPVDAHVPLSDAAVVLHVQSGRLFYEQRVIPNRDQNLQVILAGPRPRRASSKRARAKAQVEPTNDEAFERFE